MQCVKIINALEIGMCTQITISIIEDIFLSIKAQIYSVSQRHVPLLFFE